MEWFLPPSCVARRLSDTCLPIFSPAIFSSRCKSSDLKSRRLIGVHGWVYSGPQIRF